MLSNLHNFHFGAFLQNSSALPWHFYNSTTNTVVLNSHLNHEITQLPVKASQKKPATLTTVIIAVASAPFRKNNGYLSKSLKTINATTINSPQPLALSRDIQPEQLLLSSNKIKQPIALPTRPHPKTTEKTASQWKPGPGIIEKVDKTTGEIMHLAIK
uniref:Uncharacterized protein n=1 Tax=uncultured Thiotrichaceae bacterium TaxID=298394 RepID=A0A6S6TBY4_9GAMM|nr:MAG: Unknown protein [uncultured Thiotrichaceae bacterium]